MAVETRFTIPSDGTYVAYQVSGSGPLDLVLLRGWVTNVEHEWEEPTLARMIERLGAGRRVIRLDRRVTATSERIGDSTPPTVESRLDDMIAALDAAGSQRAVLVGLASGGVLCALLAAAHPERVAGLVLYHTAACGRKSEDYPFGSTDEESRKHAAFVRRTWGTREHAVHWVEGSAPSRADDEGLIGWLAESQRLSGSAEDAVTLLGIDHETDIRAALGSIHVPTIVISRECGREQAHDLAGRIPGARMIDLAGTDHMAISGDTDSLSRAIVEFADALGGDAVDGKPLAGELGGDAGEGERALATVLFADIVDSTVLAVQLGDHAWSELLDDVRGLLRGLVADFRGREVDTAGDGFFAAFDGPGRAIRCAMAAVEAVRTWDLEITVGLHTGECEVVGGQLRGVIVHMGARIAALAEPSEVLTSRTVKDLVSGAGFDFEDRGLHVLKGVPGEWRIYAVAR
jgi:class 3 adenylate cyclase